MGSIGPSKHTEDYIRNVQERVVGMIRELGIKNGPVFMQGFVDGDTVRFYDPGFRFPGGEYERLLKEITGIDIMSCLVEFALTGSMKKPNGIDEKPYMLDNHYTIQLPITARPGRIEKIEGWEEIERHPNVTVAFKRYDEGDTVPATGDVRQRICEIALVIPQSMSVRESVSWVQSKLKVIDENGENMLTSLVEPSALEYEMRGK